MGWWVGAVENVVSSELNDLYLSSTLRGRPTKIQTVVEFLETSRGNIFDGDVVIGVYQQFIKKSLLTVLPVLQPV
jgi:hypothetical protein